MRLKLLSIFEFLVALTRLAGGCGAIRVTAAVRGRLVLLAVPPIIARGFKGIGRQQGRVPDLLGHPPRA